MLCSILIMVTFLFVPWNQKLAIQAGRHVYFEASVLSDNSWGSPVRNQLLDLGRLIDHFPPLRF